MLSWLNLQALIGAAEPLTEEVAQKDEMKAHPSFSWSKRDFHWFIRGSEKHSRKKYTKIADEIDGQDQDEGGSEDSFGTLLATAYRTQRYRTSLNVLLKLR